MRVGGRGFFGTGASAAERVEAGAWPHLYCYTAILLDTLLIYIPEFDHVHVLVLDPLVGADFGVVYIMLHDCTALLDYYSTRLDSTILDSATRLYNCLYYCALLLDSTLLLLDSATRLYYSRL